MSNNYGSHLFFISQSATYNAHVDNERWSINLTAPCTFIFHSFELYTSTVWMIVCVCVCRCLLHARATVLSVCLVNAPFCSFWIEMCVVRSHLNLTTLSQTNVSRRDFRMRKQKGLRLPHNALALNVWEQRHTILVLFVVVVTIIVFNFIHVQRTYTELTRYVCFWCVACRQPTATHAPDNNNKEEHILVWVFLRHP